MPINASAKTVQKIQQEKGIKNPVKQGSLRSAGGEVWVDPKLDEWDERDYRIFCGNLGPEVTDSVLLNAFKRYTSIQKSRVIRDGHTQKSKGYGFVSFRNPKDFLRALKEMNGKFIGTRPVKLQKSDWKSRNVDKKKAREIKKNLPKVVK